MKNAFNNTQKSYYTVENLSLCFNNTYRSKDKIFFSINMISLNSDFASKLNIFKYKI